MLKLIIVTQPQPSCWFLKEILIWLKFKKTEKIYLLFEDYSYILARDVEPQDKVNIKRNQVKESSVICTLTREQDGNYIIDIPKKGVKKDIALWAQ